ncbi:MULTISPECIES: GntR family transcriptional regulator [Mesorhizobium]|uniref:DNA-binding transcriptional regulator, GntR family n=1 Tax=Mesorhizobium qingshengii TaxID=1165689 RepID=A0A1G5ZWC0_9HYPH|nr:MULTISPECIES: GntR family transcriptional regulator [Mesorhizobium]AID34967.1 FCD domain-containing protein [Mesorhizobium huakuii 7653R]MCH4560632.1 GntR family transcriptional regulator [Mesorhizobium jarvisii]SDA99111.1 DNA-binding transcriptional regulator, GntR family [Mesorhizobium qingshengii]
MDEVAGEKLRGKHPVEDVLYNRLMDAIVDKYLRPGQHLNEVKLAEKYDVPRSRVRRVLERLRDEDVVVFELHRGAFISRPTVAEAKNVFQVRRHLEELVVSLACARATSKDIAILRDNYLREREAFEALRPNVNRIAAEFHFLIAKIARNEILEQLVGTFIRRCVLVQSVYEKKSGILCLSEEHREMIDAIAAKDSGAAIRMMQHHFDHIVASLELTKERRLEKDVYDFLTE